MVIDKNRERPRGAAQSHTGGGGLPAGTDGTNIKRTSGKCFPRPGRAPDRTGKEFWNFNFGAAHPGGGRSAASAIY
jgi:hypothetical protein